ncbi:hypothetical protein G7Z17_g13205 [Cylindrodendrum hubeiense]|uniref:Uncharacterized protein n=1 Tax=Cylindrodendrum hubeiense TaxID=595255 RepID=A0A9P5L4T2_9HYPO|nr:hypothetical protein G7Z17_g13205 [Cylindrodendrum hubeiense]
MSTHRLNVPWQRNLSHLDINESASFQITGGARDEQQPCVQSHDDNDEMSEHIDDRLSSSRTPTKKRSHRSHEWWWTEDINQLFKGLELGIRMACLETFNRDHQDKVVLYHLDYIQGDSQERFINSEKERFKTNINSWRKHTADNMMDYTRKHCNTSTAFKNETDSARIHHQLNDDYSLENFATVFSFTSGYIGMEKSGATVKRRCNTVWCNLGYRAKRHLDFRDDREPIDDPTHAQYNEFSRNAVFGALQELARTSKLQHLVPDPKQMAAYPLSQKSKPVKPRSVFVLKNDDNIYRSSTFSTNIVVVMRSSSPSTQPPEEEEESCQTPPSPSHSQASQTSDSTDQKWVDEVYNRVLDEAYQAIEYINETHQEAEPDHSLPDDESTNDREQVISLAMIDSSTWLQFQLYRLSLVQKINLSRRLK